MPSFSVNTDDLVGFANRLEKLSKNDLPRVVKKTLDGAALDVKKVELEKSVGKSFTKRSISKNFYKANSKIEFAEKRQNLNKMSSAIGFMNVNRKYKSTTQAVENLEQQEHGGKINNRGLIPMTREKGGNGGARSAGKLNKRVTGRNRLAVIDKNVVKDKNNRANTRKQRLVRTVFYIGQGGYFISEGGTMFRVKALNTNVRSRKLKIKLEALYNVNKNKSVTVKATKFMERASLKSGAKMPDIFIKEAKTQIDFRSR